MSHLKPEITQLLSERRARLQQADPVAFDALLAGPIGSALDRLLIASDYAFEQLRKQPALMHSLHSQAAVPSLEGLDEAAAMSALRRYRHAESVRQIARDVAGIDAVEATLLASSQLADRCCQLALDYAMAQLVARHGQPRAADGSPQQLVVFGLGKQGGSELNFSSDIDPVFAFPRAGETDGARALDNEAFFLRLGQQLIRLLGEVTHDGFVYRVDMRLRPFGNSGRLALSFAAMEHYFQREGRDWERYAWIKARPIAGDIEAGEDFLRELRPFIYRRYFDYTAFEGLREMKAMIDAEVRRRELADHLKLGPGGIREIEFMVQLQQLIRGGREPALRARGLEPALSVLRDAGHVEPARADELRAAYRFLRHVENRLQMAREAQAHSLPEDAFERLRLARGLGFADFEALLQQLDLHRACVSAAFAEVFDSGRALGDSPRAGLLQDYWRQIDREPPLSMLQEAGLEPAEQAQARLLQFARSPVRAQLSARARARLDRLVPALLEALHGRAQPVKLLERVLNFLHAVLRRSSYLALLDESAPARARLLDTFVASTWMAERLTAHPLLLDDLLDTRSQGAPDSRATIEAELAHALIEVPADDPELLLPALNEFRHSVAFRIARATLFGGQAAADSAQQLAWLAEVIVSRLLASAADEVARSHGRLADSGIALLGFGSFGAEELGFNSDLDLVFLYRAPEGAESDGARPLDPLRYYQRLVQKLVAWLGTTTTGGRLYEVDLRLRPDGSKGMLISTLASFEAYQRERAWLWEKQALVRARYVCGDAGIGGEFEAIRARVLGEARSRSEVLREVAAMRRRMREALDRSRAGEFDLKQGDGGLVDLEFLLQAGVLSLGADHPALLQARDSARLIQACAVAGWLTPEQSTALTNAHTELLALGLACTLDGRPRLVAEHAAPEQARSSVRTAWQNAGLGMTAAPG
ncbi:bifunctional [glutamate--ammonia ligase]-adenylyl-L-tyrosine phosphorylase/[glutamate--ammonia-ligase] adenylyltransferase [Aquimonas sp.]|uniref:bifunctional [glutamate--ammonia ligase]-adenylyl-L-tyrosine phosphorylase/[glutamate--ammonia-ligase] adenylyltransferase n=1 Tax=Aquimonas sp. TaxID=1872588 RepID=UPI0037C15CAC